MKKIIIKFVSFVMAFLLLLNTTIDLSGIHLYGQKVLAATPNWMQVASLPIPLYYHAQSSLPDGSVFVTGGCTGQASSATFMYNPETNQWTQKASLPIALYWHSQSSLLDGRILVCGGYSTGFSHYCYIFNPSTDTWSNAASLPEGLYRQSQSTLNDGRVLVTGGEGTINGCAGKVYVYDPQTNSWSTAASIPSPLYLHTQSKLNDGRVLVTGGMTQSSGASELSYIYNPSQNTWTTAANLPVKLYFHSQSTLPDGTVFVTGGFTGSSHLNTSYLYNPIKNNWTSSICLPENTECHSQCSLTKGRVLVTGGQYDSGGAKVISYIIQFNQDPLINVISPGENDIFSINNATLIPKITLSDSDNDALTTKMYIDSESQPRETKTVTNTSIAQNVTFNSINTHTISDNTHSIKFEVSDGKSTIIKIVDFIKDNSPPIIGTINVTPDIDKISVIGSAKEPVSGLADEPYQYSIDNNLSSWQPSGESEPVSTIVNFSYNTFGTGGRKLVRLSNGWFICAVYNTTNNIIYFYKSTDNGVTWNQLCYSSGWAAGTTYAITSSYTSIYLLATYNITNSVICFGFDATTVTNTNLLGAVTIDSSQTEIGSGCSITIDSLGNLHAVWSSRNSSNPNSIDIRYSKSTNGGMSWNSPTRITTINQIGYSYINSCIVIKKDNKPIITFLESSATNYGIWSNSYTTNWDTSTNLRGIRIADGNSYIQSQPCAMVDQNGTIHVVWYGLDSTDTSRYNIRYCKSTDNGVTWSTPIKLTSGNSYDQINPSICVDDAGKIYIYWQGIDPVVSSSYYNVRRTIFNGSSWSPIETLTNNTSNSTQNPSLCSNVTDFIDPLYIYQDQQANAVKFSGKLNIPSTPYILSSLLPNTPHVVIFKAKDKVGNIATWSQTVYTKAEKPTLTNHEITNTTITLKVNDNNSINTQYQISCGERYVNQLGEITTDPAWIKLPDKTITITGLDNHVEYSYKIKARNGNGIETELSASVTETTGTTKPSIPQNIKTQPKSNSITVIWNEVPGATSYDVEADGIVHNITDNLYYTHDGLNPETTHIYRVRAMIRNDLIGDWSEEIVTETLKALPSIVLNLTAVQTSTTVQLNWSEIAGGGVVYQVQADGKIIDTGFENSYLDQNLPVDSRHTYRVRAVNIAGAGPWSDAINITTKFIPPTIPSNIVGIGSKTKIVVTWDKIPDTTNYLIELKYDGDPNSDGLIIDNKTDTYRVIFGKPDSTYYIRIKAKNPAGESVWSDSVTVNTYSLETPDFSDVQEYQHEVTLSWNKIDGASSYKIERNGQEIGTTDKLTYIDTGLTVETTYSYKIKAISTDNKESNWSYAAEAITLPEKPPVPDNFCATAANGVVTLSWSPVVGAVAYDLEIDGVLIENGNSTSYLYRDVAPKTEHLYRIRARNSGIEGDWNSGIKLTTLPDTIQTPSNISVSTTNTVTTVKWDKVSDAIRYQVEVDGLVVYNSTRNEFVHRRFDPNKEHIYRIRSIGYVETSDWSDRIVNNAVTLVCDKGKYAQIGLTASDVTDFSGYTLTLTYNPDVLQVDDLCTLTSDKELTIGKIKGTDVEIIQFEQGKIVFKVDKPIELGMSWSGIINRIGFKGKVTGGTTITYTVFIQPKTQ